MEGGISPPWANETFQKYIEIGYRIRGENIMTTATVEVVEVVNLTPHSVVVMLGTDQVAEFPPSGQIARVDSSDTYQGEMYANFPKGCNTVEVPVYTRTLGDPVGLPEPESGVVFIVSSIVLAATDDRSDLVAPDTGPNGAVRSEDGRIVGVRRFIRNS